MTMGFQGVCACALADLICPILAAASLLLPCQLGICTLYCTQPVGDEAARTALQSCIVFACHLSVSPSSATFICPETYRVPLQSKSSAVAAINIQSLRSASSVASAWHCRIISMQAGRVVHASLSPFLFSTLLFFFLDLAVLDGVS